MDFNSMESVISTPIECEGHQREVLNLCRTSGISVNSGNNSNPNTTAITPDEGTKYCIEKSDNREPAPTFSYVQVKSDSVRERQDENASEITSLSTNSVDTSRYGEQAKNPGDKEPSKCNTASKPLAETSSSEQADNVDVEVNSNVEYSKTSISEKIDPNNFLHLVNLDHQYLAASGTSHWKETTTAQQEQDKKSREPANIAPSYTMVKLYNKADSPHGRLRQILTCTDSKNNVVDNEIQTSIPNAALIQKHFQDMLAMTSLHPIEDPVETARTEESKDTDKGKEEESDSDAETASGTEDAGFLTSDDEEQTEDEHVEDENKETATHLELSDSVGTSSRNETLQKLGQVPKSKAASEVTGSLTCGAEVIDSSKRSSIQRDIEDDFGEDAMLSYVFDKLLHRWGEYLQLSNDKLQKFELQNARQSAAVEVSEMVADRGRYVWQLLEDIMNSRDPI